MSVLQGYSNIVNFISNLFSFNSEGRLRVSTKPGQYELVTGEISNIGEVVFLYVDDISNLVLHCIQYPTVTGHNVSFEASLNSTDGSDGDWFAVQAARSNANIVVVATGVLVGNPGYGWELSVNAYKWFRIRSTAHTSGTMRWLIQPGSYATEPIPVNQVSSVTASITLACLLYTESTTNINSNTDFIGTSRDSGAGFGYQRFTGRVFSDQSGTLIIQDSINGTTWHDVDEIVVTPDICSTINIEVVSRYNRVYFKNDAYATSVFRLTSAYHRI